MTPYYDDGECVIYHGDCRDILPALPKVDLVLTDPPYGIGLENHAKGKERRDLDWSIKNDHAQECGVAVLEVLEGVPTMAFASPMLPWPGRWKQPRNVVATWHAAKLLITRGDLESLGRPVRHRVGLLYASDQVPKSIPG